MPPERAEELLDLVADALEVEPADRPAFIAARCDGDTTLRREAESLLAREKRATHFIEQPAVESAIELLAAEQTLPAGGRVAQYEIISLIGEGGMGAVYLAHDTELDRDVALKLVRGALNTAQFVRKFHAEERILAQLNHPNIAQVHGGGVTPEGLPFFAMEFVAGEPLDAFCASHQLSIRARLQLFRKVCGAVSYAHQHLVIHRDLKPSNIRVTSEGEPKLLDFGIAKLLDDESAIQGEQTLTFAGVMTPDYASPEQVRGEAMTTASEVYSLGVLLYELLTGQRPYRIKTRRSDEIARLICETEPAKPSTAIAKGDGNSRFEIRNSKFLKGDLDNIVLMALRKEPARRYSSVAQLSEDIRRHLEGLPVVARKDTFGYRSAKFVKRHRIGVVAAAVVMLSLIGGFVATAWEARVARKQRDVARLETAKAERINTFMQDMLGLANPGWFSPSVQRDHDVTVKELLDEMANRTETEMSDQPEVRAAMQQRIGESYLYQSRFDAAEHHLRAALETELKLYGEQNQQTARTLMFLGNLRLLQADRAGAETFLERAVNVFRREYAAGRAEARWYVAACSGYGQVFYAKGDLKAASDLFSEGLKLSPRISGNERAVIAIMLTNLGFVRAGQQNLDEAEALHREALKEFHALPGRPRWEAGTTFTGLGEVLTAKGRFAEAEDALRAGLDAYLLVWGENSAYVAGNLRDQGIALYRLGDYAGAEEKASKSLEILRKLYPEANAQHASAMITVGLSMDKTGRSAQAEPLLRQALELRARLLPAGSYLVALAKGALGECLTTQKRFAEAEPLLSESYDKLKTTLGEGQAQTIEARQRLFALYQAWGKPEQAASYR